MKKTLKVLLVEDNDDDALLILRSLQKNNYQVASRRVETAEGLDAALKNESWDIVISDYSMPNFDGITALKKVNKYPHIPFVLVSGAIGEQAAVEIMKAGAHDFIVKDTLDRLGHAVERSMREMAILKSKEDNERIIQAVIKGMAQATGPQAFSNILSGIGEWLGAEHGIIGRLGPGPSLETMAFMANNSLIGNVRYDLEGTPCAEVFSKGITLITKDLTNLYPNARHLFVLEAESYLGLPLKNKDQVTTGILSFISRKKLTPPDRYQLILELAAVRTASELERLDSEAKRIRLESQLRHSQKLEAIGTMAGGIAHDFNNILTGILGYSEMAKNELANLPETQRKIKKVLQAGHRAKDLVQQILTFSRHSSDEKKVVDLSSICREAMKLLRASIPTSIEFNLEVTNHCAVNAAPGQLHQIIMNLCTNSYHAMTPNGGLLTVRLDNETLDHEASLRLGVKEGLFVRLTVTDTGHGISKEIRERIFDPYFTTKDKGVGTGLGLALIHGIVQSHNGAISVNSTEGKGTTFTIWLPAFKLPTTVEAPPTIDQNLPRGTERILLVDDEQLIRQFSLEILELAGYTVTLANNGYEAYTLFQMAPAAFDLILTDMTMPKMSGMELAQKCLTIRPDIPIILCTGFNDQITKENALHSGIFAYLTKPIPANNLCQVIRQSLDSRAIPSTS